MGIIAIGIAPIYECPAGRIGIDQDAIIQGHLIYFVIKRKMIVVCIIGVSEPVVLDLSSVSGGYWGGVQRRGKHGQQKEP